METLKKTSLKKNDLIKNLKNSFKPTISYLKMLSSGSIICKTTKLMIVWLAEAGKTSLLNSLRKPNISKKPKLTNGINIKDWKIKLEDNTYLNYSIWDFAGQLVYYNTHQFFLSKRAINLVVW